KPDLGPEPGQDTGRLFGGQPGKAAGTERAIKDQDTWWMGGLRRRKQPVAVDAGEQGVVNVGRINHAGNLSRVRLAKATSVSITGTSTNTPTTVASAAP